MWLAKFRVWHNGCRLRPLCMKHQVTDCVSIVKSWKDEKSQKYYYIQFHLLKGSEKGKRAFARDMRKLKDAVRIEHHGDVIIALRQESITGAAVDPVFDPGVIQVKPVVQRTDGFEDWEFAAWEKKKLTRILQIPIYQVKLLSMQRAPLEEIFLPRLMPKLAPKQRAAFELALAHGYYAIPRKSGLQALANLAGVRWQTYREHLRKAELKLLPFMHSEL